jgi:hypothetical protein
MPHHHDNCCGQETHDHDHSSSGPQDNLFACIDRSNVVALNTGGDGPEVIKPWHERLDEGKVHELFSSQLVLSPQTCTFQSLTSDADDQM